jgi:hypothetical protein
MGDGITSEPKHHTSELQNLPARLPAGLVNFGLGELFLHAPTIRGSRYAQLSRGEEVMACPAGFLPRPFAPRRGSGHKGRMSETELRDLERREKQATPAPWTYSADPADVHEPIKASNRRGLWSPLGELRRAGDGPFIAAMRNALPRLLSELRAARAESEKVRAELAERERALAALREQLETRS